VTEPFIIEDPRFSALVIAHAKLECLWQGGRWLEGPAYFPAGRYLVFSDIPNDRLMRFCEASGTVAVFRAPANHANGNTRDGFGRLVTCEHGSRAITRTEFDGSVRVLAASFEGRRFNSPNDVITHPDGSIWFTDPTYGIDSDYEGHAAPSELGGCFVFRLDPESGAPAVMADDRVRPNGLAFSPDASILYVADTGATHVPGLPATIHAYPLLRNATALGAPTLFASLEDGLFDGFRVDQAGNLWTSAGRSVRVYAPDGTPLGLIPIGERVANLAFGGPKRNRLYITAQTGLYALFVNARGN
jgi:gluconolactonase